MRRGPYRLVLTGALGLGLGFGAIGETGCSPDFHDGLGPRVPVLNVSGQAERDGTPAASLDVSVRNPVDSVPIASTKTDANGSYEIGAPSGIWEIRIKGKVAGDFDSVTRGFVIDGQGERVTMVPMDVFAYGATLRTPLDASTVSLPSGSDPVGFAWRAAGRPFLSARVQVYDSNGAAVWYSGKGQDSTATWDGTGNQGEFAGVSMPPATYTWRVKFDLPDSSDARTKSQTVTFQ